MCFNLFKIYGIKIYVIVFMLFRRKFTSYEFARFWILIKKYNLVILKRYVFQKSVYKNCFHMQSLGLLRTLSTSNHFLIKSTSELHITLFTAEKVINVYQTTLITQLFFLAYRVKPCINLVKACPSIISVPCLFLLHNVKRVHTNICKVYIFGQVMIIRVWNR